MVDLSTFNAPPQMANIEATTRCNARCVFCPWGSMRRKNRDIPLDDLKAIVARIANFGVHRICFHLFGEPTLYPWYPEILQYTKENFPQVYIREYTNGSTLLDERIRTSLLDLVDEIIVSIDGITDEEMVATRPGLDPTKIREGVAVLWEEQRKRFRNREKPPRVIIRVTLPPEKKENRSDYEEAWKDYCNRVKIAYLQNFHGTKPFDVPIRSTRPCPRLFTSLVISVNQNVLLCCDDCNEEYVIGNLKERSLEDLWFSDRMNEYRKLHLAGRSTEIEICSKCTFLGTLKLDSPA